MTKTTETLIPYVKSLSGDLETPVTLYHKYVGDDIGFLLESNEYPKGRYSFMGRKPYMILTGVGHETLVQLEGKSPSRHTGNPLELAKSYLEKYHVKHTLDLPFVGGAVGTVGYDMIRQYERLDGLNKDTLQVPDMHLLFVKELIAYDHETNRIYMIVLDEDNPQGKQRGESQLGTIDALIKRNTTIPTSLQPSKKGLTYKRHMDRATFERAVGKAKDYIYRGDIFQVVLSRRWSVKTVEEAFSIYRRLRQVNPSPYMFYMQLGTYQVAGSSPEMLVDLRGDRIQNCPIAGTCSRGATKEEDDALGLALLADEKERAEHTMLVDLGRNDMGKVSEIGSVEVKKYMEVTRYAHVIHLVSLVEGRKALDKDPFQVLMSFLPAGTLSGAPKIRAMEIIDELEEEKRGIYGGAIGYIGFDGNLDMCIAIRTMVIKDGLVTLQAGAGIVADSVPSKEYEETEKKVSGMIAALEQGE